MEDSAGTMMENKRNVCTLEEKSIKRHKSDLSFSSKERKDKLGERISALQQLVSPYGKTDTASVLLEGMQYIQFLQEQIKVLSAPYLQAMPTTTTQEELQDYSSLRSRGLCLVPIEYTSGVTQTNGADIWAPEKKDKLGERISALQQLVSPYGKTDTASVLLEGMQYIQFLQEQIKVRSAPYLQATPTNTQEELQDYSLRSRGLCLVPIEYTSGVTQTNGADIWAPVKTSMSHDFNHKSSIEPFR